MSYQLDHKFKPHHMESAPHHSYKIPRLPLAMPAEMHVGRSASYCGVPMPVGVCYPTHVKISAERLAPPQTRAANLVGGAVRRWYSADSKGGNLYRQACRCFWGNHPSTSHSSMKKSMMLLAVF